MMVVLVLDVQLVLDPDAQLVLAADDTTWEQEEEKEESSVLDLCLKHMHYVEPFLFLWMHIVRFHQKFLPIEA